MKKLMFLLLVAVLVVIPATAVAGGPGGKDGNILRVPDDYATIQEAVDAADPGDTILVGPGEYAGAIVNEAVHIQATGIVVINDGPNSHSFLRAGFLFPGEGAGSGSTIRGFRFEGAPQYSYVDDDHLDFPIFSRGASDVTIEHNVLVNSLQAITNWSGSGWDICHNTIEGLWTLNGGGIGIFIGDNQAVPEGVKDNTVSHNRISGILNVLPSDGGGYCGTGIVLYADFRGSRLGAVEIADNRIVHNKVSLTSDTPEVVDVVAIELTDSRDDPLLDPVIFDNAVGFNDLRDTVVTIALTPASLDECNDISRNLGHDRGQGLHPSAFGPGS